MAALLYSVCLFTASLVAYRPTLVYSRDYPVHTLVTGLVIGTILPLLLSKHAQVRRFAAKTGYDVIPLQQHDGAPETLSGRTKQSRPTPLRRTLLLPLGPAATFALCVRVELTRRIQLNSACSTASLAVFVPLLVAVYDALRFQIDFEAEIDGSIYEALRKGAFSAYKRSKWRFVPPAALLSFGCYALTGLWATSQSTYICPVASNGVSHVFQLQLFALLVDTALVIAAYELSLSNHANERLFAPLTISWYQVTAGCALIWIFITTIVFISQPGHRKWLMLRDLVGKGLAQAILCCVVVFSISAFGMLHITMILTGILNVVPGFVFLWTSRRPFPPVSTIALTWPFVLIYFAWSFFRRLERSVFASEENPSLLRRLLILTTFTILIFPGLLKKNTVHLHPIDLLMSDAQNQARDYINQAARSKDLPEAVQRYQDRYRDKPPPGFDVWFDYARNRSVAITDEFDQISEDLLPFRATSPADLRKQTWEMVSNPWNEISGITIRNGRADVQENVLPTHRWMLEGVAVLINSFAQYLPDMDLAFNLNDESRVAVKHDEIARLRDVGHNTPFEGKAPFSSDRSNGWLAIPVKPTSDSILENWSGHNTFPEWGTAACHASSAARSRTPPVSDGQLCIECALPHSMGQFVSNWSLAADPCHQPDLVRLHGFYTSPAAFKATHELRPIFSQSKAHGYNDILYPSAWNYRDKVMYNPTNTTGTPGDEGYDPGFPDPLFSEKQNVLYWRGATTEGLSPGTGTWRGMVRQRLVHMANNYTSSSHDFVSILLPDSRNPKEFTYTSIPGTAMKTLGLNADILFVDRIHRCGGRDCRAQDVEFLPATAPMSDFQSHWQYRFLFDVDGAGFSGRFLPFLQSHSLPFRTALFRQWYHSRLTPWLHFVPQDLRLHGLWSTLAYFAGIDGTDHKGRKVQWKAHHREAELIAETGREWAGKVLRKEDMEVYFFRLLLEWGRLSDDRRDDLGFTI